ncbi:nucleoside hydrolase [Candidatus Uabimicrobium amorphum]|uniref:Nucleoside hydrolase n=1 Tax=Uabimicrobium amorphum TaxID=2596890 RepID=A0A5S9F3K4_UABAM|nr:nucleoside hydrolase [Candidatus Uabimicrobium amorphum]BBM84243.1 nucleoside hydrolase [Candidatus Uabimicrobium amorphum]
MEKVKIFLDTDIGSDVDDAFALALALNHPQVELCGVSTVYGPTQIRAQIAQSLINAFQQDIPVGIGESTPISKLNPIWTTGNEQDNLKLPEINVKSKMFHDAIELMRSKIEEYENEIIIVCIGPMTNIAHLIAKYPRVTNKIKRLVFMGGGIQKKESQILDVGVQHIAQQFEITPEKEYVTFYEHNLGADPAAANAVLNSDIPKIMVGRNVTHKISFPKQEIVDMLDNSSEAQRLLKHFCAVWEKHWRRDIFYFHDPLALSVAIDPTIVRKKISVQLYIDNTGYTDSYGDLLSAGFSLCYPENSSLEAVLEVNIRKFYDIFRTYCLK